MSSELNRSANLNVFDTITRINASKILTKPILFDCKCKFNDCKCKFNGKKRNSDQKWNKSLCRCECKYSNKTSCMQKRLCL